MKEVNKVNIKKINDFDKSLDDLINCYRFDISSKADLRTAIVSGKNIFYQLKPFSPTSVLKDVNNRLLLYEQKKKQGA